MHFWIDKRSSQLHGYGGGSRGRIPGPGGFYSRTFGQRHGHPPPLLRTHSQPPVNSSASSSSVQSRAQNQINANNPNSTGSQRHNNSAPSTTMTVSGQIPTAATSFGDSTTSNRYQNQTTHLSMNPMDNMMSMSMGTGGNFTSGNNLDIYRLHGMRHGSGLGSESSPGGNGSPHEYYMGSTGGDPVIGLSAGQYYLRSSNHGMRGGMGSSGLTGRRPRSHSHSASGPPSRRRSSSSATSSGGINQRRSSVNRWTYDPYNISHHQQIRHSHQAQMWPDGRQLGFEQGGTSNGAGINNSTSPNDMNPSRVSTDLTSGLQLQSSTGGGGGVVLGAGPGRGSTSTTSTRSIVDPSWRRTKRIGLTLCFLSFILMSTVAAKFVIEGPWLIDKSPRSERTEATIYFFLTEIIFVLFAMALFFAGVTCLRKRTNAYLLRQFNDYIMHSSPQAGGRGDYFGGTGGENGPSGSNGGMNRISQNIGNERPFLGPQFLLENHLMNMHISVAESSNIVMTGLSKPPPYHIALYLPVPESSENSSSVRKEERTTSETISNSKHRLPQHMQNQNPSNSQSQPSSWISSCLADPEDPTNDKTDEDGDSGGDEVGNGDSGRNRDGEDGPKRKRRKNNDRPETPPPPYGQI